jgi:membrane protease YdiL (CAAX protease family)
LKSENQYLYIIVNVKNEDLGISEIANMLPAIVKEFGFRDGVVHFLQSYYGKMAGLAGGSILFGIVHIIGRIFGDPVWMSHITGVAIAGLLLSFLVYKL